MFARLLPLLVISLAPISAFSAEDDPADLVQARTTYEKEVEFATRPIRDRYLSKLEILKRTLGARGDARGSLAVQEEIDRVTPKSEAGFASLAGTWKIVDRNGGTRVYTIRADGSVVWTEENGGKIPTKTAKIRSKGGVFTLSMNEREIARLSASDGKLIVDYFIPESTYPNGAPAAQGIGTIITRGK